MATTALAKWTKYFSQSDVDTTIKPHAGKPCYFYSDRDNRRIELLDGTPCRVLLSEVYEPRYRIQLRSGETGTVNEAFVAKPNKSSGTTENLRCHSGTLSEHGDSGRVRLLGIDSDCKTFNSPDQLMNSILYGLRDNWRIPEPVYETFLNYADSGVFDKIDWHPDVSDSEINELGKYVGELIPGLLNFDGKLFDKKYELFGLPTESSFSGVDSFLKNSNSNPLLISSKYGPGARASFFSNLLPKGMNANLGASAFKEIRDSALRAGVSSADLEAKTKSKDVLYEYGINTLLKMNVANPKEVFNNIRTHCINKTELSKTSIDVLNAVVDNANSAIKELLPHSTTAFFARQGAERLDKDSLSIDTMKSILADKQFIQLRLNSNEWKQGRVSYSARTSSDAELRVYGNKAAMNDIDGRQGTISYELR